MLQIIFLDIIASPCFQSCLPYLDAGRREETLLMTDIACCPIDPREVYSLLKHLKLSDISEADLGRMISIQ